MLFYSLENPSFAIILAIQTYLTFRVQKAHSERKPKARIGETRSLMLIQSRVRDFMDCGHILRANRVTERYSELLASDLVQKEQMKMHLVKIDLILVATLAVISIGSIICLTYGYVSIFIRFDWFA